MKEKEMITCIKEIGFQLGVEEDEKVDQDNKPAKKEKKRQRKKKNQSNTKQRELPKKIEVHLINSVKKIHMLAELGN